MKTFEEADNYVKQQFIDGTSGSCSHYGRCDVADLLCFIYQRYTLSQEEKPSVVLDHMKDRQKGLNKRWE